MSKPEPWAIFRTVLAYGVAEGHYTMNEASSTVCLGTYPSRRAARNALPEVARAEAADRRLTIHPFDLPRTDGDYPSDGLSLVPVVQEIRPTGDRARAAHLNVLKRVE